MDWKRVLSKSNISSKNSRWLMMLAAGLICLILAWPSGRKKEATSAGEDLYAMSDSKSMDTRAAGETEPGNTYEAQLEARLENLLSQVEGVGEVKVMIVLKESEEKIWRSDISTSVSSTQETDQGGGTRKMENQEQSETTILSGASGQEAPILEKEIFPQIGGVVISAQGGGNTKVQADITEAVEALLDVPPHKIKVLKMVSGS